MQLICFPHAGGFSLYYSFLKEAKLSHVNRVLLFDYHRRPPGSADFGDYVEDAVHYVQQHASDEPCLLFGHSMGSLVVRAYIQKYEEKIDKLIVCGSPSKNSLAGFGLMLNGVISAFRGKKYRSRLMANASTGGGDDKFPGEGKNAWLTRDKTVVEKYNADEKCNFIFSCNGFSNLLHLVKNAYKKKKYPAKHSDLPIFFMAGADDPVIGSEKKWLAAQQFLRDVGYKNVTGKLYPKMRHEILNELGKEEVYADALAFIEKSAEKQA